MDSNPSPVIQVAVQRVSAARLAANRLNALKSTGPRTPGGKLRSSENSRKSTGPRTGPGKARSSRNARKHGVWSMETIPPSEYHGFIRHLLGVIRKHKLQGGVEKVWGIAYAHAEWLMLRVNRRLADGPPQDPTVFDAVTRHMDASTRLIDRLNTLTRWWIRGLEWEKLKDFPGVAEGRAVMAAMPRLVVRSSAEPAAGTAGDGGQGTVGGDGPIVLRERSEATGQAVLRERSEATGAVGGGQCAAGEELGQDVLGKRSEATGQAVLGKRSEATGQAVLRERSEATGAVGGGQCAAGEELGQDVLGKRSEATAAAYVDAGRPVLGKRSEATGPGSRRK